VTDERYGAAPRGSGSMRDIQGHFEAEAAIFDENIIRLIPGYREMVDALVSALSFPEGRAPRVLDLGCGTGTVARAVLERWPESRVTCLDMAERMLEMAKLKLERFGKTEYIAADFSSWDGVGRYDAIVSSLALHHLPDDAAKRAFFAKAASLLEPGGAFFTADVVLSGDPAIQARYLERWRAFMLESVSEADVDGIWFPSYEREDRPAVLVDQLVWLTGCGFSPVDVIWKQYNFAVYGGKKAREAQ
jgi:tRNA (cmo5U34)-methyltransferase